GHRAPPGRRHGPPPPDPARGPPAEPPGNSPPPPRRPRRPPRRPPIPPPNARLGRPIRPFRPARSRWRPRAGPRDGRPLSKVGRVSATTPIEPPDFALEQELRAAGAGLVAGVDEVGRGAWAGPVVVCAAVAGPAPVPEGLTDSKRLTPKRRTAMAELLRPWVADHAVGRAEA